MDNKPENRFDGKMDTPKKAFIYASKPPKLCRKTCWITTKSTFYLFRVTISYGVTIWPWQKYWEKKNGVTYFSHHVTHKYTAVSSSNHHWQWYQKYSDSNSLARGYVLPPGIFDAHDYTLYLR